MDIWVVAYYDNEDTEPTVTAFSNEDAATKCFETFTKTHTHLCIDKVPVYSSFVCSNESNAKRPECPYVEWEETDYDIQTGHSSYRPICTKQSNVGKHCYSYCGRFCKYRNDV